MTEQQQIGALNDIPQQPLNQNAQFLSSAIILCYNHPCPYLSTPSCPLLYGVSGRVMASQCLRILSLHSTSRCHVFPSSKWQETTPATFKNCGQWCLQELPKKGTCPFHCPSWQGSSQYSQDDGQKCLIKALFCHFIQKANLQPRCGTYRFALLVILCRFPLLHAKHISYVPMQCQFQNSMV